MPVKSQERETRTHSEQEWREISDKALDRFRHTIERIKNGLTSDNLRLSERYINFQLKVLVVLSLKSCCGYAENLVARYQRSWGAGSHDFGPGINLNPPFRHIRSDSQYQAMLVDTVKFVDMPECIVTSDVALALADDFFRSRPHSLYFSVADGRCVLLKGLADRKIGVPVWSSSSSFDKLPCEVVKGTSKVVNDIPDNRAKIFGDRFYVRDIENGLRNFDLFLGSKTISIGRLAVTTNSDIQILDVLFGSFGLQIDTRDSHDTEL